MKTEAVLIILSCLHTAEFPKPAPQAGDRIYCFKCGHYKDVAQAPHNYSVRCGSCSYHRVTGNALIAAEIAASRHALRRPGHRAVLVDGQLEVRGYVHETLPADAVPPF
jgi:hypothetical protein